MLRRLQATPGTPRTTSGRQLGLHFDLTVPFARYVLENAGQLAFPFRRYQIQKVWRGERPQEGRFREFTQADIDVVGDGDARLPLRGRDARWSTVDALRALPRCGLPGFRIQVNNRKVVEGFYRGLGLDGRRRPCCAASTSSTRSGRTRSPSCWRPRPARTRRQAKACLALAAIQRAGRLVRRPGARARRRAPAARRGAGRARPGGRGGAASTRPGCWSPTCGSRAGSTTTPAPSTRPSCSGTRTSARSAPAGATTPWPATAPTATRASASRSGSPGWCPRLVSAAWSGATRGRAHLRAGRLPSDEERRSVCDRIAAALRRRGIPVEVAPSAAQVRQADPARRPARHPVRLVPAGSTAEGGHEVRDIRSGEQVPADPATWQPPAEDLHPRAVPGQ